MSMPVSATKTPSPATKLTKVLYASAAIVGFISFVLAAYATSEVRALRTRAAASAVTLSLDGPMHGRSSKVVSNSVYAGSGSWHAQGSMTTDDGTGANVEFVAVSDHQAVSSHGGYIYLLGGVDGESNTRNNILKYDVVRQTYREMEPLRTPRAQFGAGYFPHETQDAFNGDVVVDRIVVAGGVDENGVALTSTEIYSVDDNETVEGPDLDDAHLDGCMASLDGYVYMIGGWTANYAAHSSRVERLGKDEFAWSPVADLPQPRGDCAAVGHNGKVYVVGGYYSEIFDASEGFRNSLFSYDPITNEWTQLASMKYPRGDLQLVSMGDTLLAIGGEIYYSVSENTHKDKIASHYVEEYFPEHDIWEERANLVEGRFRFAAAASHWGVHAFGGSRVCRTPDDENDFATCLGYQMSSHEVFFEGHHPDIWVNYEASE
jgi:N-acetylneuraminic acid mutarotase